MKKLWTWCWDMYRKYKEIINYLIVGGLTTVLVLAIYYVCVSTFLNPEKELELQIANCISWTIGVAFAYFTNRYFVFESKEENKVKEAGKFLGARIITLLMDMLIMRIGVISLKFNDKIVKLFSQFVIIVSNYVFSKIFVFKKNTKEKIEEEK